MAGLSDRGEALAGLRVLEIGNVPAAGYCGRVFADFGADVLRAEPPGGSGLRARAPRIDVGGGEEGAWSLVLNANKRAVTVEAGDTDTLVRLAAEADIAIVGHTDTGTSPSGLIDALRETNPDLIVLVLTWFGEDGPYAGYKATEITCRALAGMVYLVGPAEGPPTPIPDYQSDVVAGLNAFAVGAAALHARRDLGGRRISLAVLDCAISLAEYNVALDWSAGRRDHRWGKNRFWPNYPLGIYRCKEGWIGVTVVTFMQWVTFCELTGMDDLAHHPDYAINRQRIARSDELEARFAPVFLTKTAQEWFEIGLEARMPIVVVPDMEELLKTEEFRRRGAFRTTARGDARFALPVTLLGLEDCPPRVENHVEAPGCSPPQWPHPRGADDLSTPAAGRTSSLDGLLVVDLSMGWAGPHASRLLGDLGADIVKVEACGYPDWWRGVDNRPIVMEQRLYEKSGYFNVMNRNKRGITLDLTTAEGVALTKALVAKADIVIENYSASVLPKLGLDYAALTKVRPDLIMVSMPAFPADGPWREVRAYGSTLEQAAGLPRVAGADGAPPQGSHIAYGDPIGGITAAAALMLALLHRNRTGRGQKIDLSQVECSLAMVAPWIAEQSATGRTTPRMGKGHPAFVPYGSFPCRGEDAWVTLAVETEAEWKGLCTTIGAADLGADASLTTLSGRRPREVEIDAAIAAWTAGRTPEEAMAGLQAVGVPAGIAHRPVDLLKDPHLCARGFWQEMAREWSGPQPYPSPTFREGSGPLPIRRAAPTLGQHNEEVLEGILGLSAAELAALEDAGIIGKEAVPPHLRKSRAAGSGVAPRPKEEAAARRRA
ncbi:CaiB/BaiF CoA transferase family protein [Acuticoccus kandeliae]|uniref:CaiB/BaiF CoA transferase family protein n=1 Tax=Acuticoccus kandeliae TaxID=2073160 RepID=UPI000D3E3CCE|nr:CoA transferase [Acuticoccus kandeliae]